MTMLTDEQIAEGRARADKAGEALIYAKQVRTMYVQALRHLDADDVARSVREMGRDLAATGPPNVHMGNAIAHVARLALGENDG